MKITSLITAAIMMTSVSAFAQTSDTNAVKQARQEVKAQHQVVKQDRATLKADKAELKQDVKTLRDEKQQRRAEHKAKTTVPATK